MDQFLEFQQAVQTDLNVGTEVTFYSTAVIKLALNRSYRKSGVMFDWPMLDDAQKTSTEADQEYYDYPPTWRPNSIWKVTIDDKTYGEPPDGSPLTFHDYLAWKEDPLNIHSSELKWANQWMRYFVFPTPTTDGNLNMVVWGRENVVDMVADEDITIFSYSMPECNEAICLEAVAILKAKGEDEKSAAFHSIEAKSILTNAWDKIRKESGKYEKNQPFFDIPDFFGRANVRDVRNRIGNF